jgi:chaperone BCS1
VFTTNYIDDLDPALIRRGRMDMHIEMSYCEFGAFKTLAKNYLGVDDHRLFDTIEELLKEVEITPADVAECLMASNRTDRDADACLERLIDELNAKKKDQAEAESAVTPIGSEATANGATNDDGGESSEDDSYILSKVLREVC